MLLLPLIIRSASIFTGCIPQQLSDGTVVSDGIGCGAPLHTLGIRNGIVCYDSIDFGATAVYSCSNNCGDKSAEVALSVRTCLPNGSWSGAIPKCECGKQLL